MKKLISVLITLFTASLLFAAPLRDYVCIVQPDLSQENIDYLKQYAETLKSKGYKDYAKDIELYLRGSFGSGFIFYASDGKPYVVTNRHVLAQGSTATIKFDLEEDTIYKDLRIVAIDEEIDIGLVALPDDFNKPGLTLSTETVSDGDDVWSAGFPGLGNEPMWQLGKGIVSNSRAKIKELLNPEISSLIQHSAQVDAGNSGGPLMKTDASTEAGYKVIGINTWKAVYRENTNYAIPASIINEFVEKAINADKAGAEKAKIEARLVSFDETLKGKEVTYKDMGHFISNQMIRDFGQEAFLSILQRGSTEVRSYISNAFAYDPLDGIRYSLGYKVWKPFQNEENVYDYQQKAPVEKDDGSYEVVYLIGKDEYTTNWIYENNYWKIKDFSYIQNSETGTGKNARTKYGESLITLMDPFMAEFKIGGVIPKADLKSGLTVDFNFNIVFIGIGFYYQSEQAYVDSYDAFSEYKGSGKFALRTTGIDLRLQLPLNFTYVLVEPYVAGKIGWNTMDNKPSGFAPGADLGLDVALLMFDQFAPETGVKFTITKYKNNPATHRFAVYGGVKFLGGK